MSKDRYSDDHTIEIIGGTNTLTIDQNLVVENSIETKDITCETIAGSPDLAVSAGVLSFNSNDISFQSTPYLQAVDIRYKSYPASSLVPYTYASVSSANFYYSTNGYWHWSPAGSETLYLTLGISDIPDGAKIRTVGVSYSNTDSGDVMSVAIKTRLAQYPGSLTTVDTITLPAASLLYKFHSESLNFYPEMEYDQKYCFINLTLTNTGGSTISIYGVVIEYQTDSVGK